MKDKLVRYIDINNKNNYEIDEFSKLFNIKITISDKVHLHRKHFSESTVFYTYFNNNLIISNDFLSLVDALIHGKVEFSYNMSYVYNYLMFQTPYTSETIVNEIDVLRAGEIVSIAFDGTKKTIIDTPPRLEEKESILYNELKKIPSKLNFSKSIFHLSAGLDSSLLALLSSKKTTEQISTVSFLTLGDGSNNEITVSNRLAEEMNSNHQIIDLRDVDIFAYGKEFISEIIGYPIAHPSHILDFMVNKILSLDYEFIISGKGPDDCLGGYKWHTEEYKTIDEHKNRLTVTNEKDLKFIFNNKFESDYNKFLKDFNIKESLSLENKLNYDLASISSAWDIIHNAESNNLQSSILSPLNDEHIRMLMYNLPNEQKIDKKEQKVYLRRKFKDLYPKYLLDMPKYGLRLDISPYLKKIDKNNILNVIFSSKIMEDNINKESVEKMIENAINGKKNMGWQIWSLYLVGQSINNLEKRKFNGK